MRNRHGPAVHARFTFHGELDGFLARVRRGREAELLCAENATVKHMVEALGVPHTEIGLVLVNGAPASLSHLLQEGDRVGAWPVPMHPHAAPAGEAPRFVADSHLGGLARYLRMAGFDTLYDNAYTDAQVEALATTGERTILTRDRALLKRRSVTHGCYVHAQKPQEQFAEVAGRLALHALARPFTRCLHCNAPLVPVPKSTVEERLPPAVRDSQQEFSTCPRCHRIFWQGSHWRRMREMLAQAAV